MDNQKTLPDLEGFFVAQKGFLSNEIIEGMRILSDLHRHIADRGLIPATA